MASQLRRHYWHSEGAKSVGGVPGFGGYVKQRRSWFALVTFCATTVFVVALALTIIFVTATAAYALAAAFSPSPQEFSGVISDSHCMGRHIMNDKSPEECTRLCVTQGSKYVLRPAPPGE